MTEGCRAHLPGVLVAALLAGAAGGCAGEAGEQGQSVASDEAVAEVGRPVPAYAAPMLAGDTVSLASLRGHVVLLNVWATWCPPCREEMPGLARLQQELGGQGLRVVTVSIDGADAGDEIRRFLDERGLALTALHDPDERVGRTFRTVGVPESFLIGRDGTLLKHWVGAIRPGTDAVRAPIRAALAETPERGDS